LNSGFKILLLPLSFLYGLITLFRNVLYTCGVFKVTRFDVNTIGVGNLAMGGAGKTPLVEYFIRLLKKDFKVSVLSRGYKRKTRGFVLADNNSTASDIGDEPLIYKSKYDVQVAVDNKRVNGVKNLISLKVKPPDVILLDDVFQHRAIKCGLNIVVSDYNNPFFSDHMFPYGTLREYKRGIRRADVIIISKTPDSISPIEIRNIIKDVKPGAHQRLFFSYLKYGELYAINNIDSKIDTLKELYKLTVVSFAGIANATPMINYLKEYANDVKHLPFNDHHNYSVRDLFEIERFYLSLEGEHKILVTTEKDFMRLQNEETKEMALKMNIFILPVEVTFKDCEEEFNELILAYVRSTKISNNKYASSHNPSGY
jgi:tetraacyldisaccharide 4'-kinase